MDGLIGITFGDWCRLLARNRFDVDLRYWRRVAHLTIASVFNSRFRRREERLHGPSLRNVQIQPPVFVLGHWRNGTTLLHTLLAQDDRFAYPNMFQISFPHCCLSREALVIKALESAPSQKRAMDNMEITFRSPGEDEGGLAVLSLCSPLLGWSFPRREEYYERYLTFRDASPEEVEAFRRALILFLRKLTWRYNRPVILKSPGHTARVRLMLETFPQARFVHICRDPYAVFQSMGRLYEKTVSLAYLQRPPEGGRDDGILRRYATMYDAYFEDRSLIPAGALCEIRFEDLEKDPVGQIRRVYRELNLPDFEQALPKIEQYAASLSGYKKNVFTPLPGPVREKVSRAWARNFREWGYPV
ncbi:MAG: sulfotransferase [Bryobacterales bacterium]|nr:sulfotransferase [Bryobacterales bacterium]